jgi:hypothetical protein
MRTYFFLLAALLGMAFTTSVSAQALSSVSPSTVYQGSTVVVTISGSGTNFNQGSSTIHFAQGGTVLPVSLFQAIDANNMSATFHINSNAPTGYYDLSMTNTLWGGAAPVLTHALYVGVGDSISSLTTVTPDSAHAGNSVSVTITGKNPHFNQGAINLNFSQGSSIVNMVNYSVIDSSHLFVNLNIPPGAALGPYRLYVKSANWQPMTRDSAFWVLKDTSHVISPQILKSVTPNIVSQGSNVNVTISGSGTHFNQGSSTIQFTQGGAVLPVSVFQALDSNMMSATLHINSKAHTGYYDLSMTNTLWSGPASVLTHALYVSVGDSISSLLAVTPDSAHPGVSVSVTISGNNAHFNQGQVNMTFRQGTSTLNVVSFTAIDSSHLAVSLIIPVGSAFGPYQLNVDNTYWPSMILDSAFWVTKDTAIHLSSVVPSTGSPGQLLTLRLAAKRTRFDLGSNTVVFTNGTSNLTVTGVTVIDSTHLSVNITVPANAQSSYDAIVTNTLSGQLVLPNAFAVPLGIVDNAASLIQAHAYPNPFTEALTIELVVPERSKVSAELFNLLGERLSTLVNTELNEGAYTYHYQNSVNGVYLLKVAVNGNMKVMRVIRTGE